MTNKTRETQELQKRYGHLFDNFTDNLHTTDYKTNQELEKETRDRYGHLVDYMKPDNTIYDNIMGVEVMCRNNRKRKEEEHERANARRKERMERERRDRQEHMDRNNAFVNSMLEKKEAERKALQEAAEQRRREDEKREGVLNSLHSMNNIGEEMSQQIASNRTILERDAQHRKEYEEKMEWYRKQGRK